MTAANPRAALLAVLFDSALLDVRTLDRALRGGPEAVRAGMTRDRVIAALADLEIAAPEVRERRASR